jgi:hypothetical protein
MVLAPYLLGTCTAEHIVLAAHLLRICTSEHMVLAPYLLGTCTAEHMALAAHLFENMCCRHYTQLFSCSASHTVLSSINTFQNAKLILLKISERFV